MYVYIFNTYKCIFPYKVLYGWCIDVVIVGGGGGGGGGGGIVAKL
jgi:hypothetical protein